MVRSDSLRCLGQDNPELAAADIERLVDLFFDAIARQMAAGGRVELRGFGVFEARWRRARAGRNPKNGSTVAVLGKRVPFFKAGKTLRARLNGDAHAD